MATKTGKRKRTHYQRLQRAKSEYCQGKRTKRDVKKVANEYIKDAVKKAAKAAKKGDKRKIEKAAKGKASKSANRVLSAGCMTSTVIQGRKKSKRRTSRKRK